MAQAKQTTDDSNDSDDRITFKDYHNIVSEVNDRCTHITAEIRNGITYDVMLKSENRTSDMYKAMRIVNVYDVNVTDVWQLITDIEDRNLENHLVRVSLE